MSSLRLLFYTTLMLMVSFTFSFLRDARTVESALPIIISLWIAWGLGVAWVRAGGHRR